MYASPRERLVKGLLDLIVMAFTEDSHGLGAYDLIGLIHAKFEVMVSPGVIYPTLFSLEREGLLKTRWKERKKVYELTDKGEKYAINLADTYVEAHRRILDILQGFRKPESGLS